MTIQEILSLDLTDVDRLAREEPRELRKILSAAKSVARKRVTRSSNKNIETPILKSIKRSNVLSQSPKNIIQVKSQLGKVKKFLSNPQSTIRGAERFRKDVLKGLGVKNKMTDLEIEKFWKIYSAMSDRGWKQILGSKDVAPIVADIVDEDDLTLSEMLDTAQNKLTEFYENRELSSLDLLGGGGVSEFFD